MADNKKVVFVAFAIEDVGQRDMLKGHSLNSRCPLEYIDMSVKEAYETDWKEKVRTRIRRSDGVIALVSKNSLTSSGQKWEIQCAKEEGVPILGIWIYKGDLIGGRAEKARNDAAERAAGRGRPAPRTADRRPARRDAAPEAAAVVVAPVAVETAAPIETAPAVAAPASTDGEA